MLRNNQASCGLNPRDHPPHSSGENRESGREEIERVFEIRRHNMYLTFGDKIKINIFGQWHFMKEHIAERNVEYAFSGARFHYPNTEFRFTRCGTTGIPGEGDYLDIFIPEKDCEVGFERSYHFVITEIVSK